MQERDNQTIHQLESNIRLEERQAEVLQRQYEELVKVADLLPDAANSAFPSVLPPAWCLMFSPDIIKLEKLKQEGIAQMMKLAEEWERIRSQLMDLYRKLRDERLNRHDDTGEKLERVKEMRAQIQALTEVRCCRSSLLGELSVAHSRCPQDIQRKDEAYAQALEVFERMPKSVSRAHYTRRILDIVKNVKKQKVDINKVHLRHAIAVPDDRG